MGSRDDHMFFVCYKLGLGLCIGSPEDKHHGFLPLVEDFDDTVRKDLPSLPLVGIGLSSAHCQHCVQKQYSLLCPVCQIAVTRHLYAQIIFYLFIYVHQ